MDPEDYEDTNDYGIEIPVKQMVKELSSIDRKSLNYLIYCSLAEKARREMT